MRSAAQARRLRQVLRRATGLTIPMLLLGGLLLPPTRSPPPPVPRPCPALRGAAAPPPPRRPLGGRARPVPAPGARGPPWGTTNPALNQPATASSTETASFPASAAVDGNTGTRWSSAFSDPQWIQIDLGTTQSICQVTLNWETAYATAFQLQPSPAGTNSTTIYPTPTATADTPP